MTILLLLLLEWSVVAFIHNHISMVFKHIEV